MQKPKDFYVYLHRRATDGKVFYVGKGCDIKRAYNKSSRSEYWKRIVNKHGYTVEIYLDGLQEWYAFDLEIQLIAYYGRENLCNLTEGGEGASGFNWSEESKTKFSIMKKKTKNYNQGKKASDETRKKMSDAQSGIKHAQFGKKRSQETKQKLSSSLKNRKLSDSHVEKITTRMRTNHPLSGNKYTKERLEKKYKKVLCVEENLIFSSQISAAIWICENTIFKASAPNISSCCKEKRKHAYGYTWRYA